MAPNIFPLYRTTNVKSGHSFTSFSVNFLPGTSLLAEYTDNSILFISSISSRVICEKLNVSKSIFSSSLVISFSLIHSYKTTFHHSLPVRVNIQTQLVHCHLRL